MVIREQPLAIRRDVIRFTGAEPTIQPTTNTTAKVLMDQKTAPIAPSPTTLAKPLGVSDKVYLQQNTPDDPLLKTQKDTTVFGKAASAMDFVVPKTLQAKGFTFTNPWIMGGMVLAVIALYFLSKK